MLELDKFKILVDIAPLVSIDFIIKNSEDKILLGKRVNRPACGYFFTLGGRLFKNETINEAKKRVLKDKISKILIQSLLECLNTFIMIVL